MPSSAARFRRSSPTCGSCGCIYGDEADSFPTGAIGVFSYLNKIHLGVRQFLALNRKFDVAYTDRTDLIPLTYEALDLLNGTYLK